MRRPKRSNHELEHQRRTVAGILDAVDRGDVRMVRRCQQPRFALERCGARP
jgi:hypothetical protein